jgi:hypothetical protein
VASWTLSVGGIVLAGGSGAVDEILVWNGGSLGPGAQTLSLTATDLAGSANALSLSLQLVAAPPAPSQDEGSGDEGPALSEDEGPEPEPAVQVFLIPVPPQDASLLQEMPDESALPAPGEDEGPAAVGATTSVEQESADGPSAPERGRTEVTFTSPPPEVETATGALASENLLWGGAAAGLIGYYTTLALEEQRKRKQEEARAAAEAAAANREASSHERGFDTYRAMIDHDRKVAEDRAFEAALAAWNAAHAPPAPPEPPISLPEGLPPEARAAFEHGGQDAQKWISEHAPELIRQHQELLAKLQDQAASLRLIADAEMTQAERLSAYKNTERYQDNQASLADVVQEDPPSPWDQFTQAIGRTITTVTQAYTDTVETLKQAYSETVESFKQAYSATVEGIEISKQAVEDSLDRTYGYHGPVNLPTGVTGQLWMPAPSWFTGPPEDYMLKRDHVDQFPTVGKASIPWPSRNECVTAAMLQALNMIQDQMAERVGIAPGPPMDLHGFAFEWDAHPRNWLWRLPANVPLGGGMLSPHNAALVLNTYADQMRTNWGCSFRVELTSGNAVDALIENLQNGYPTMLHFSQDIDFFGNKGLQLPALLGGLPHTVTLAGYDANTDIWMILDPGIETGYTRLHTDELMAQWGRQFLFYPPRFAMTTLIPDAVCTLPEP